VAGLVVAAYFVGTFPTALLVGRHEGFDPLRAGSGNPGASNTFRVGGRRAGTIVLVVDVLKGALAAGIGLAVDGRGLAFAMGIAAVLGHIAPATRGYRGGKGVATALGMVAVLYPRGALIAPILFAIGFAARRAAAAGSIAAVLGVVCVVVAERPPAWELAATAALSALILARHRGNLAQLRRPTGTVTS
jgi:glycerol-3-phosphate acyltransferase PlsY